MFCLAYLVFCLAFLVFCLAYLVFCLAYLVFCLAYLVFYLAYLVFGGLFGVHYIFFGVIGICGIGILYLLHLEFGMVHLIFSSQKNAQILRSLWKKVRRFEKGTPPLVVAVVTIIRCVQHQHNSVEYNLNFLFFSNKVDYFCGHKG